MNTKINSLLILLATSLLGSCTFLLKKIDQDFSGHTSNLTFKSDLQTYCQAPATIELVSENERNQQTFYQFIKQIENRHRLTFIDKSVLWAMVQMNLRPDQNSPTSRLSVLFYDGEQEHFHSFYGRSTNTHSYLLGLDQILKLFKSNYNLRQLAGLLDGYYPDAFFVSRPLEDFLTDFQKQLEASNELKATFMRGTETLQENERLPKQNFSKLVSAALSSFKEGFKHDQQLISYNFNLNVRAECNFDLALYRDNVYLINPTPIKTNIFGMKHGIQHIIFGAGQKFDQLSPMVDKFFFQGYSNTRTATFCSIKNKLIPGQKLWLTSTSSRDPGQHLYHLLEYGIGNVQDLAQVDKLVRFSRHLFLKNPTRLIFESDRSQGTQAQELLKLNIPIYSADGLGQVWGVLMKNGASGFVLDERHQSALSCIK